MGVGNGAVELSVVQAQNSKDAAADIDKNFLFIKSPFFKSDYAFAIFRPSLNALPTFSPTTR